MSTSKRPGAAAEGSHGRVRTGPIRGWGLSLALLLVAATTPARAQSRYLDDFSFIQETVAKRGAAVQAKGIDWPAVCREFRPDFEHCTNDVDHVKNCMRLLAKLRDSHTGVTRSSVDADALPSKWDGLYGGGLWLTWDQGRIVVRGVMDGHPLAPKLPLGSVVIAIGGEPAWIAMEREAQRIETYAGQSTRRSLFASMGNRLLPFGDRQTISVQFLTPAQESITLDVPRWGPGGKAYSMFGGTTPPGVEYADGAVSRKLSFDWCSKVGYLRITGGMNAETARAYHAAFDALKGIEVLILDCRSMGGGSDAAAWEMVGRLFAQAVPNGPGRRIEPSGTWQFTGPVVMLQDALEVSSAETFTWAASETERVVSIGDTTGGWGIIPNGFECPSGLVDFRLGVNDRPTPIHQIHTEGRGWPADVQVPLGARALTLGDPIYQVGLVAAHLLRGGVDRVTTIDTLRDLVRGDSKKIERVAKRVEGGPTSAGKVIAQLFLDDLATEIEQEARLLDPGVVALPDFFGAELRHRRLVDRAPRGTLRKAVQQLAKLLKKAKKEVAAQEALAPLLNPIFPPDDRTRRAFLKEHEKTATAQWAASHWK